MDNGPEVVSAVLRVWCHIWAAAWIEPGSSWENPCIGSFGGRLRDEGLDSEGVVVLLEAQVVLGGWRAGCNACRPYRSLGGLTRGLC